MTKAQQSAKRAPEAGRRDDAQRQRRRHHPHVDAAALLGRRVEQRHGLVERVVGDLGGVGQAVVVIVVVVVL
jgi:hypothetical protein